MRDNYRNQRRDFPRHPSVGENNNGDSDLPQETWAQDRARRHAEKRGESLHGKVEERERTDPNQIQTGNELGRVPPEHPNPLFQSQLYAGAADNLNPAPPANTAARTKYDNERREQDKEKQYKKELQLGNTPQFSSAPRPGPR